MRNTVFGVIGVIWGTAVVLYSLFGGSPPSSGSYEAGQFGALAFGVVLVVAGGWTLAKRRRTDGSSTRSSEH